MTSGDDRDLGERFAAWRREEETGAPRFERVWPRAAGSHARRAGPWLVAAAAGLSLAAFFLLRVAPRAEPRVPLVSITGWKAPTDFLLQVPGREILNSVPRLGQPVPVYSLDPLLPMNKRPAVIPSRS